MNKLSLKYKVWELRADIDTQKYKISKGTQLAQVKLKGKPIVYYCVGPGRIPKQDFEGILDSCAIIHSMDKPLKMFHREIRMCVLYMIKVELVGSRTTCFI